MHSLLITQYSLLLEQEVYRVAFQADGTCAIAFTYIWTNDDPIHVAQEVVGRKLLYAHAPLSFPVELYSTYLGDDAMVPVRVQCVSNLFTYDPSTLADQEITLTGTKVLFSTKSPISTI